MTINPTMDCAPVLSRETTALLSVGAPVHLLTANVCCEHSTIFELACWVTMLVCVAVNWEVNEYSTPAMAREMATSKIVAINGLTPRCPKNTIFKNLQPIQRPYIKTFRKRLGKFQRDKAL